jgi:gliding motility-associated-like protein
LNDCPEIRDTIQVDYSPAIAIDLGPDTTLCPGQSLIYDFRDSTSWNLFWQDNSQTSFYTIENEGLFWVNAQAGACTASDTLAVEIIGSQILPSLPADTIVCEGEPLLVEIPSDIPANFLWQDGDTSRAKVITQSGNYSVTATDACQIQTATLSVVFDNCDCPLFIPNVFSPNDDGFNDTFKPETDCIQIQNFKFQIFDRWGELIFKSENLLQGWDGTFRGRLLPPGVYAYFITYDYLINSRSVPVTRTGDLTLIR